MKITRNLQSGHMDIDQPEPPRWFKAVLFLAIVGLLMAGAKCSVHGQDATNRPAGWATNSAPAKPPITDLGVIGLNTMIRLEKCERRTDFVRFKVEIIPRNARGWTNKIVITTTNEFLRMDDLAAVPEGVAMMGVRSYCGNGDASPVSLFVINVQRAPPDAPKAYKAEILRQPTEQNIEHVIEQIEKVDSGPAPPMPPGMIPAASPVPTRTTTTNGTTRTTTRTFNEPLPGGTNQSYAQYQWALEKLAASGQRLKNNR